jgi:hypothetical protein
VYRSSAAWGDCDNDGDLDILLTGDTGTGFVTNIYRNSWQTANVPPSAPTNLSTQVVGSTMTATWDPGTDAETPSAGLTYNLRVGTTPGGAEICGAMADASTGCRTIPAFGNTNHNTSWKIELPSPIPSALYWSVQAVDACFAGSQFATDQGTETPTLHVLPTSYALHRIAPNPFGTSTTIRYDLPQGGKARLEIFNVMGQRVRTLLNEEREAGWYSPVWDGRDAAGVAVSPGVYFVRLESGEFSATRKVMKIR